MGFGSFVKRVFAAALIVALPGAAVLAEGRTVVGRISALDPAAGTVSVTDAAGKGWNYRVEKGSGIDLSAFRIGDRVEVTIARATPLNMMSAADLLRKGDRVRIVGGY